MNAPGNPRLVSLLEALFRDADELQRFVRQLPGTAATLVEVDAELSSFTATVEQLAAQLEAFRMVDHPLFDHLLRVRSKRKKDIERTRREILGPKEEPEPPPPPPRPEPELEPMGDAPKSANETYLPYDDEYLPSPREGAPAEPEAPRAAWGRRMAELLDSVEVAEPELPAPWCEAAAVLPTFDPLTLRPVGEADTPRDLLARFAAACETLPDGRMSLGLRKRQEVLDRLLREGRVIEALDANPEAESPQTRWLRRVLEEGPADVVELRSLEDLQAAHQLSEWLAASDFEPFDRDRVASVLERYRRVEPLRRLLGRHFRGRAEEIATLRAHLLSDDPPLLDDSLLEDPLLEASLREDLPADGPAEPKMVLWGVGGVGKSTLLGKVLLDLEQTGDPWVYLDFDDPEIDPLRPRRLVELIARQLGQFFAGATVAEAFLAMEFAAAEDDSLRLDVGLDAHSSIEDLLSAVDVALHRLPRPPALSLVFDTFEQVQVRGSHAVHTVGKLLDNVLQALPYARVVVSGRARVVEWPEARELELEDLDDTGADAVLEALGVEDDDLRRKVIDRVGRSPLSLRLAADALRSEQLRESDLESMVVAARRFEIQGQLYTRILGHIGDAEVRRLAHPGLIVRRVTVAVIREVLAELCDIEPERAPGIFERLPRHVALFEPDRATDEEGSALRHRQDVREIMLRLMMQDPAWGDRLREIHDRAVAHYAGRDDDLARAEEIYHRLMRDDDPDLVDDLWRPGLAESLARCWEEPLPERARAWLGPRIGRHHASARGGAGDELETWRTEDWEVAAAREVEAHLQTGDAVGALEVLGRRSERSAGSRLFRLEARALADLERWSEAAEVVDRALGGELEPFGLGELADLHRLAARAAQALGRTDDFETHVGRALDIAAQSQDAAGRLRALDLWASSGEVEAVERLERALLDTREADLRRHDELTRRILGRLQPHSAAVLRKVATTFGNRAEQKVLRRDSFQLEDLLKRVDETELGKARLSELAGKVGLSRENFKIQDLAQQSIRYDKLGDALVTALDHGGDDEKIRAGAEEMLRDLGDLSHRKGAY